MTASPSRPTHPTILYLARHGQTEWNALGRLQGHTDVPLSDLGRSQAMALAESLREVAIGAVVTSDLARARDTGRIVVESLALTTELVVDANLRERGFGIFEGLTRDECLARHAEAWQAWRDRFATPEGGEESEVVVARFAMAMERAAKLSSGSSAVLVIAHGAAIRMWLTSVTGRTIDPIGNGAVFEVCIGERVSASPWPDGWLD